MQFQVNEQDYFLAFVEDERQWYVFAPTAEGTRRFPVYVDGAKFEKFGVPETGKHKIQ